MSSTPSVCVKIGPDLVATAMGDARPTAALRVHEHVDRCTACRQEFHRYQAIDRVVVGLPDTPGPAGGMALARERLESRLADLRSRLLMYRIFPSPLGNILIARSEQGVSLVEYLERGTTLRASRLGRLSGLEVVEDGGEVQALYREVLEYLEGKRTRFEWPLDLRLARSDFHRTVLQATAKVPYGGVMSYTGIARAVGKPAAVRAVAQALRWNPVPIVVPCHRIVGVSGSLTGYAGNKIDRKQRLLATEGIPTVRIRHDLQIASEVMYVGDREVFRAYCLPTCPSLSSLTLARFTLFGSCERAEAAGLTPCTTCRPNLHPLSQ